MPSPIASELQDAQPLVITLALAPAAHSYFQSLRSQHFPAERNQVPAHLSLFHALPGRHRQSVLATLRDHCPQQPMPLQATGLLKLGHGVAIRVQGEQLRALHTALQQLWWPWLTAQDKQGFRPHVVIQNKADPAAARALYEQLAGTFQPFPVLATGVAVWRYMGGPWQPVETVNFAPRP